MRIRMTSLTQLLPALLVLVAVGSTQAQTNSQSGYMAGTGARSGNAPMSRYRLVPTAKKTVAMMSNQENDAAPLQFERTAHKPAIQKTTRVAAIIPAKDDSTSPVQLNPTVDASAFDAAATYESSGTPANYGSYDRTHFNRSGIQGNVTEQEFTEADAPQYQDYQPQQFYQAPMEMAYDPSIVPMNRNFFGIDPKCCCDEWDGFIPCGGLKAYPGHYGQPFIVGCDPCEPPCGRCSKCLVEKHRNKRTNSNGCQNNDGESCNECTSGSKKSFGIHGRGEKKKSDCGCASCTAQKGGILTWLK